MKKNKKHKWKYQINIKKKILVLVVLGVFLFIGLGYAILEANLGITGTLEVSKYDKTLYGVFKKEVNKGYALKYTGEHQDSMDPTKSTEDIYHFYANTDIKGNAIRDKFNVVFAGLCWQMIRTTDTGGVRLLYNGEARTTKVDGETQYNCDDDRTPAISNTIPDYTTNIAGTYLYSNEYIYTTTKFELVNPQSVTVDASNASEKIQEIVENYPYTCINTTGNCYSIYKIDSQSSETSVYTYKNTGFYSIGDTAFNKPQNSLASGGYMYGNYYLLSSSSSTTGRVTFKTTRYDLYSSSNTVTIGYNTIYYADSYDWNETVANKYTLVDPQQVTSDMNINSLLGKYLIYNNPSGTMMYYVIAPSNGSSTKGIVKSLSNGDTNVSVRFSDSLTNSGDTLDNPTTLVELKDYVNDYQNYVGKYTCGDASFTCSSPMFISATTKYGFTYLEDKNFIIAKNRNGLVLSDYIEISSIDWYKGYNTTYEDYFYTCGNTNTVCAIDELQYITIRNNTYYNYAYNRLYGSGVIYENGKYKLQNVHGPEVISLGISNYRYTCMSPTETECDSMNYILGSYRITYNDPNIVDGNDVIDSMLKWNTTDSLIKASVDNWYEKKLKDTIYESKIDDTIFCNDRSFSTNEGHTFEESGWNPSSDSQNLGLYFNDYDLSGDLSCPNITDRFSVSNEDAKLKYPIALATAPEIKLFGNPNATKIIHYNNYYYYLLTPDRNSGYGNRHYSVGANGSVTTIDYTDRSNSIRPVISLVKGTKYSQGDGSMTNPYVVDMSN